MAFDRQFLEFSWIFKIPTTDEMAVTSCKMTDIAPLFDAKACLAAITMPNILSAVGAMETLMTSGNGLLWANYSRLSGIKIAAVGVDGKYVNEAEPVVFALTPAVGGNTSQVNPQATVCVSLRSTSTFGMANFGRMYLPHTSLTQSSATLPYSDSSVTTAVATAAQTFVHSMNSLGASLPEGPQVRLMSNLGAGTTKTVASVGVGRVVDTQRRRRNRLTEEYSFAVI